MNIFVAVDNLSVLVANDTLNGLVIAAQSPREAAEHIRREITNILRASPAVDPTVPNLTAFGKPVSTGTWTEATLLLTQANAFAKLTPISATNYHYFVATGGTGVTPDIYTVTANTANTLTLGTSLSSAGVDLLDGDITGYFFALLPASSVNNLLAIPKRHFADGLDSGLLYHLQVTAEEPLAG
jgi:hypothetical protein